MTVAQPLVQASLLGEAIDSGPVLVFVSGDDMRYVAVNQYACDVLGYTRAELLQLTVPDVTRSGEARAEFAEVIASPNRTGTAELVRKDGTSVTMSYRASKTRMAGIEFFISVGWVD